MEQHIYPGMTKEHHVKYKKDFYLALCRLAKRFTLLTFNQVIRSLLVHKNLCNSVDLGGLVHTKPEFLQFLYNQTILLEVCVHL